ncbi:MAG: hypothetical protein ABIE84_01825, partial [bacterium]
MISLICFGMIYLYLFFAVFISYWQIDQAQYWDSAVHLFAAWFTRTYTFPDFTGWNPFFFAGYPHDTFYGPLFHYIVALLSFPLGLLVAQKTLYIITISILPPSYYYFARKFGFNKNESSLMTLLMMFAAVTLNLACGGTLYSLFLVGLAPHALAMPLYFVFAGKLKEVCRDFLAQGTSPPGRVLLLLVTLSVLLLLTHFVVIFAAVITAGLIYCFHFSAKTFRFALKHLLLTALCSAFFWLPMVFYLTGVKDDATILSMGFFLTLPLVLLIVGGAGVVALDKDNRFDPLLLMLIGIFSVMVFIDFGQLGLPMDAYRFIFFFLSFAMMLPAKLLLNNLNNEVAKRVLLFVFIALISIQLAIVILPNKRLDINR